MEDPDLASFWESRSERIPLWQEPQEHCNILGHDTQRHVVKQDITDQDPHSTDGETEAWSLGAFPQDHAAS